MNKCFDCGHYFDEPDQDDDLYKKRFQALKIAIEVLKEVENAK